MAVNAKFSRETAGAFHLACASNEDCGGVILLDGDDVQHRVHAVDKIDVPATGRTEHHFVARRASFGGVGSFVERAVVGFHFSDDVRGVGCNEIFSQKLVADKERRPREKTLMEHF